MIVTALLTGAGLAAAEAASGAGRDAYEQLKALVRRRLSPETQPVLEAAPETDVDVEALRSAVRDSGVASDATAVGLAEKVLELAPNAHKYATVIHGGVKGLVQGDSNVVHIDFRERDDEPR